MAVVGFALFGPGAVRSFDAAQVWGGPTEGARRFSWRILGIERFRGIDSTKNLGPLVVRARLADGAETSAACRTRADGACDVELPLAADAHGAVHVEVTGATSNAILATGDVIRDAAGWDARPGHPSRLPVPSRGDLAIEVLARRGVFAAPFRDDLIVLVKRGDAPVRGAKVTLRADAADVEGAIDSESGATRTTSEAGEATFALVPQTHTVEASVEASALGLTGGWDGLLPVLPGAMWLDPAGLAARRIRIVSPVARDLAYATLATPSLRVWGGAVPLAPDAHGFSAGEIAWPLSDPDPIGPLWLTVASDPRASGAGTVGWPITAGALPSAPHADLALPIALGTGERPFRDWLLLDGMPMADRRDSERRGRARRLSAAALGAAAVIEGVLLARTSSGKGARSWVWLLVAVATVALAFAAIGVVAMWKTG